MLDNLFEKYLNVSDYFNHTLYIKANAIAIDSANEQGIEDHIYEGYIIGFIKGYIETTFKAVISTIKMQLKEDTLELADIEKYYYLGREDILYLLKQILNNNL